MALERRSASLYDAAMLAWEVFKRPLRPLSILLDRLISSRIQSSALVQEVHKFAANRAVRPEDSQGLCFFAHFDPQSRVDDYVFYYLSQLRQAGFDLVFVTSSAQLAAADLNRLSETCCLVVLRRNRGLDFGSWKVGLDQLPGWLNYRRVLFANDSVFGPFKRAAELLQEMEALPSELIGATDNYQHRHHLQSYFLYFKMTERVRCFLQDFWADFRFLNNKKNIVRAYEIGLSLQAGRAGIAWQALHRSPPEVLNSTHDCWKEIIVNEGYPFLKRELITKNPSGIANVGEWPAVIRARFPAYPVELIERYLKRIGYCAYKKD